MNEIFAIRPVYQDDVIFSKDKVTEYQDWYFDFYKLDDMHRKGFTGKGVKVGVIDTGVPRHDDIVVMHGEDSRYGYHRTDGEGKYDRDGHATHVCGIIAAKHNGFGTKGVAPDVELYAMKALGDEGGGTVSDIINAGNALCEAGVKIANLSLGMSRLSTSLYNAITEWYDKGMICICAAGNDGRDEDLDFPAFHPLTIAVGSHDVMGNRSVFSDDGGLLDVYGAGDKILSTYNKDEYQILSGTSMATPFVTGMIAAYYDALIIKYGRLSIDMIGDLISKKIEL